jgi:hypothetical protein
MSNANDENTDLTVLDTSKDMVVPHRVTPYVFKLVALQGFAKQAGTFSTRQPIFYEVVNTFWLCLSNFLMVF